MNEDPHLRRTAETRLAEAWRESGLNTYVEGATALRPRFPNVTADRLRVAVSRDRKRRRRCALPEPTGGCLCRQAEQLRLSAAGIADTAGVMQDERMQKNYLDLAQKAREAADRLVRGRTCEHGRRLLEKGQG